MAMTRTLSCFAAAFVLVTGAVTWQTVTAQSRREEQFENDQVRVWKSIILPNQPISLHRHDHGRTIVAITGGTLDIVDGAGKTLKKLPFEAGKAYWLGVDPPGEQHADLNRGTQPIEVMVIEMRR